MNKITLPRSIIEQIITADEGTWRIETKDGKVVEKSFILGLMITNKTKSRRKFLKLSVISSIELLEPEKDE